MNGDTKLLNGSVVSIDPKPKHEKEKAAQIIQQWWKRKRKLLFSLEKPIKLSPWRQLAVVELTDTCVKNFPASMPNLRVLTLIRVVELKDLSNVKVPQIRVITIKFCPDLERLFNEVNYTHLREFTVTGCHNLVDL